MENKHKEIAKAFLQGVITGNVREVYDFYTLPNFKHHNGFFNGDRESLLQAMIQSNEMFPNKKLTIKLAVAEMPYVTLFSHVKITEGKEAAVVHMYRFEGDKIAELWDISQEVPQDSPNENGMF
jgi:predicted SnoaL-like aldol condensation-catalyzing enzyme